MAKMPKMPKIFGGNKKTPEEIQAMRKRNAEHAKEKVERKPFHRPGSEELRKLTPESSQWDRVSARFKDDNTRFTHNGGFGAVGRAGAKGAIIGAGTEGSIEYMSGGDFWEGAKGGAVKGAMVGAGFRTVKQRTGAQDYFGDNGIRQTMGKQREQYGAGVRSLLRNQKDVKAAEEWVTKNTKERFK